MNILLVNQSVVDLCASLFTVFDPLKPVPDMTYKVFGGTLSLNQSLFTVLSAVVEVDGTRMSRDSIYDQFVCRIWLTRLPLWTFLTTSTYGMFLAALERYAAVVYYAWYHNSVRSLSLV